jgi:putative pyruvate formate lyase activating enzyme
VRIKKTFKLKQTDIYSSNDRSILETCTLCPRECHVNRFRGGAGFCGIDAGFNVASVCIHKGEEPSVSGAEGICNIFFEGCNLRCVYCQNHEISCVSLVKNNPGQLIGKLLDQIEEILLNGIGRIGFVSPSHTVPQVKALIKGLNERGLHPVTVYNTSSYDKVETLRGLSEIIDVYLPDFKYVTPSLAADYSGADDYPEVALKALKEMYYQKGSVLRLDDNGLAENGLLIRHLVLPGHAEESIHVLRTIAEELSPGVSLSLMSQYHPVDQVKDHPVLGRAIYKEEYEMVVTEMENLGFRNGYVQEMDSFRNYLPDFRKNHPFEY